MGVTVVIILTLLPALALLPKARAGCSNAARPDPCGGPPARAVPTATRFRIPILRRPPATDRLVSFFPFPFLKPPIFEEVVLLGAVVSGLIPKVLGKRWRSGQR